MKQANRSEELLEAYSPLPPQRHKYRNCEQLQKTRSKSKLQGTAHHISKCLAQWMKNGMMDDKHCMVNEK
jgi:hypothetical protein